MKTLSSILLAAVIGMTGCATSPDGNQVDIERAIPLMREAATSALVIAIDDDPEIRTYVAAAQPLVCSLIDAEQFSPESLRNALTAFDVDKPEYFIVANLVVGLYETLYGDVVRSSIADEPALSAALEAICQSLETAVQQTREPE